MSPRSARFNNVEKDKKGGLARTHKKSLEVINSASESLDLIDAWRVLNPDSSRFTWRQKKPEIQCRLDFFLINQCTFYNIINAEILAGYKTDHSMITLQISLRSNTRGRGFWKLNTSFLSETEYVNHIKSTTAQTIDEYSQDNTVDPGLSWEMVKMKVRDVSIKYGTTKKRNLRKDQEEIEISITTLEEQLTHSDVNDKQKKQILCDIEGKKRELETIIEYQTRFYDRSLGGTMRARKTLSISSTLKRDTVNKQQ